MTLDITKLTETELKALAFDEIQKRDLAQQNIQIISTELDRRRLNSSVVPKLEDPAGVE